MGREIWSNKGGKTMSDNEEVKEIEGGDFEKVVEYIRENGITHFVVVGLKHEAGGTNFTVMDNIGDNDMTISLMGEVIATLEAKKLKVKGAESGFPEPMIELTDGEDKEPTIQ